VNWTKYAQVIRGDVRTLVLSQVCQARFGWKLEPKTKAEIHKQLLDKKYPIGLGAIIRAMRELETLKLIRRVGVTKKKSRPLYLPTITARRILDVLPTKKPTKRISERFVDNAFKDPGFPPGHEKEK